MSKTKLELQLTEAPELQVFKDGGKRIAMRFTLDNEMIKSIPFFPNEEAGLDNINDVLDELGSAPVHRVNWRRWTPATYKLLAKMWESKKMCPPPCFMGTWTVEVDFITASRWTDAKSGKEGLTLDFMGLRPLAIEEGYEPLALEDMAVKEPSEGESEQK